MIEDFAYDIDLMAIIVLDVCSCIESRTEPWDINDAMPKSYPKIIFTRRKSKPEVLSVNAAVSTSSNMIVTFINPILWFYSVFLSFFLVFEFSDIVV